MIKRTPCPLKRRSAEKNPAFARGIFNLNKKASFYGKNNCLLIGVPGVGKTTVFIRLAEKLKDRAAGFYTAEIRQGKRPQDMEK